MIRLSTQFDRAVSRPTVAAPKSHGCCCCCCCCIVTVIGGSVITARATSRALRAKPASPPPKPTSGADGWSNAPIAGEPPAAADAVADAPAAAPAAPPSVAGWITLAALFLPLSFWFVPVLIGGIAIPVSNAMGDRIASYVATGVTLALFAGVIAFLVKVSKLRGLGVALLCAPMVVLTAAGLWLEAPYFGPIALMVATYVGGLIALARRGVPTRTIVLIGVLVPIVYALEFGAWLGVLVLAVSR